jgi:hypothetical protein
MCVSIDVRFVLFFCASFCVSNIKKLQKLVKNTHCLCRLQLWCGAQAISTCAERMHHSGDNPECNRESSYLMMMSNVSTSLLHGLLILGESGQSPGLENILNSAAEAYFSARSPTCGKLMGAWRATLPAFSPLVHPPSWTGQAVDLLAKCPTRLPGGPDGWGCNNLT